MDLQKELNEWADWFIPHDSKDLRDALELNGFNQLNVEKLLAINGLFEVFAFRAKDSWAAWQAAKAQAVPDGFVVVNQKDLLELTIAINAVDLATHTESKTNEVREMWQQVALKLMALGTAQEQKG